MKTKFLRRMFCTVLLSVAAFGGRCNNNNGEKIAKAVEGNTQTLEITIGNFDEITTDYKKTYMHDYNGITIEAYGVYNNGTGIQMNSKKSTYIKNTTAFPGPISQIVCTWTESGKNSIGLYGATDAIASKDNNSIIGKGSANEKVQTFSNLEDKNYNYFYFDGTTVTGACYLSSLDITYYTSPIARDYTVTFDTKGGSQVNDYIASEGEHKIDESKTITTKEGYKFGGWYKEDSYENLWDFNEAVPVEGLTLYAKWDNLDINETFVSAETVANISFGYTKKTIVGHKEEITQEITSDYVANCGLSFPSDSTEIVVNGKTLNNDGDDFSMTFNIGIASTDCRFWKTSSSFDLRLYKGSSISFKSLKETSISKVDLYTSGTSISTNYNSKVNTETFDVNVTDTIKIKKIVVTFGTDDISTYSDFNNIQLQFHYEFDVTGEESVEEVGIFVTDDLTFDFDTSGSYDDEYTFEEMLANGAHGYKSVNTTKKADWTVGINLSLEDAKTTTLRACAYVKTNGKYYFCGTSKEFSVKSFAEAYIIDMNPNEETTAILNALIAELSK